MSDLDPVARALMAASRHADEPSDEELGRVERSLMTKIAAGTGVAIGISATTKAAGSTLSAKLLSGLLVVGLAAGGGLLLAQRGQQQRPAQTSAAVVPRPLNAAPAPVSPAAPEPAPPAAAAGDKHEAPTAAHSLGSAKVGKLESSALKLKAEAALIGEAQRALGAGRATEALARLGQYDQSFPSGALRSEAEATRVFALCQSGRTQQSEAAKQAFLKRYPASPAAPRVRSACAAR